MPNVENSTCAVKTIECDSADEFLDAISPRSEHFMSLPSNSDVAVRRPKKYIFRGHENDNFSLIPSALRLGQPIKWNQWGRVVISRNREQFRLLRGSRTIVGDWTNRHQIKAELAMTFAFFQFADASGLSVPDDHDNAYSFEFDEFVEIIDELKSAKIDAERGYIRTKYGSYQSGAPSRLSR